MLLFSYKASKIIISKDKEKIRIAEEKIREDLKNKTVNGAEENSEINNGINYLKNQIMYKSENEV